jgi:hypothetical protein
MSTHTICVEVIGKAQEPLYQVLVGRYTQMKNPWLVLIAGKGYDRGICREDWVFLRPRC